MNILKLVLIFLISISPLFKSVYAQKQVPDSIKINPQLLAKHLTRNIDNDYDKALLLFNWVSSNISYDNAAYRKGKRRINASTSDVLKRGQAVCLGYSQLYVEMCQAVDLQSFVIDGYSKQGNQIPDLEKVDHAWSTVFIDGKWFLQDVTWANGNKGGQKHFCPSPEDFVREHLPADPMWQLLKQPMSTHQFKAGILSQQTDKNAFSFLDSIHAFLQLPSAERSLKIYQNTLFFNDTQKNREQLGQAYFDYGLSMNEMAERLQEKVNFDSLFIVQETMLSYFRLAAQQHPLFDWQKENFANTLINQAVTLSQSLNKAPNKMAVKKILSEMKTFLLEAKALLTSSKSSFFAASTLETCEGYLVWVEEY